MNNKNILKTITIGSHTVKFVDISDGVVEVKVDNLPHFLWLIDNDKETIDMWCKFLDMEPQVVEGFVYRENKFHRHFSLAHR